MNNIIVDGFIYSPQLIRDGRTEGGGDTKGTHREKDSDEKRRQNQRQSK